MSDLQQKMLDEGYTDLVEHNGVLYGLFRFLFTVGLCCNLTDSGYSRRYCYHTAAAARAALHDWRIDDFSGEPTEFITRK